MPPFSQRRPLLGQKMETPNDMQCKTGLKLKAFHFSWLGLELLVCYLAHRVFFFLSVAWPTGVFLLLLN